MSVRFIDIINNTEASIMGISDIEMISGSSQQGVVTLIQVEILLYCSLIV